MERIPVPRGALERLQSLIKDGGLRVGDGLPAQRELAARLSISRASLREAISALETLGMVSVQPGRGVFVAAPTVPGPAWRFADSCTPRDVYEARVGLEPFAAALAAERMDEDALGALRASVAAIAAACDRGDVPAMAKADSEFHDVILASCGNVLLAAMYRSARDVMVESQKLPMLSRSKLQETVSEHRALLEAFEARDAARAAKRMKGHIVAAARRLGIALGS
jgi:GntR family transcriptional repressor for pyruvate dehydrogenase complex